MKPWMIGVAAIASVYYLAMVVDDLHANGFLAFLVVLLFGSATGFLGLEAALEMSLEQSIRDVRSGDDRVR